ncbi:RNA polymerase sigma-70 factor [Sphingobacterium spiritivorum ATCC 33300]|uniref:RNA polymerase sigma-70 factor n=2 Tax=Sphingobacterium spiritivorum TaxID=258 RepID=C2FWB6_SPHSI|nr:RNA polymerase sigma-70 factor [Sphingobacterium spiritivorum ATCC 33300]
MIDFKQLSIFVLIMSTGKRSDENKSRDMYRAKEEEPLRLLFNDVFYTYEKALFRLALNTCKDEHVAHDIVHDVFLKLWEIRQQLHEIKSIESFLFTMTRNKIMDHLRKVASDARLRQAILESMQTIVDQHPAPVEYKEYKEILRKAVDNLPEQRKAIYLMRDEGYNYQEIADEFDISRHTVKNQISAAMKSIRKVLSKFLTF